MINKNLILTFFIIILAITLLKNREQFEGGCSNKIKGCKISNLANVNPDDIYDCLIKQCNSIIGQFDKLGSQYTLIKQIGIQMKNYFIMLYMNNLEKYYKGVIIIAVAPYVASGKSVTKIVTPDLRYFIKDSHEKDNIYELIKPLKLFSKSGINTIQQIGYLISPIGFNIGISQPDNNPTGSKCSGAIRGANSGNGPCIPAHLGSLNNYLRGGKAYDINSLMKHYTNTGGTTTVWTRHPLWLSKDNGGKYWGRGKGNRKDYQKHFNWHTAVDDTMGSCWLGTGKPASTCNYAYGNSMFKHINVIVDENFFNIFYASSTEREKIRKQFKMGNFNSLKDYF
jgi:hypothetical protein